MSDENTPTRIRLSRQKGWRKPENTVVVSRPSIWGNPFKPGEAKYYTNDGGKSMIFVASKDVEQAVENFRWFVSQGDRPDMIRDELAGKNLACWCPLDQPCHADVLLELANGRAA